MTDPASDAAFTARVNAALDRMRPALALDGGDVTLLQADRDAGLVRVALTGSCSDCNNRSTTVLFGVERALKRLVPGVTRVEAD